MTVKGHMQSFITGIDRTNYTIIHHASSSHRYNPLIHLYSDLIDPRYGMLLRLQYHGVSMAWFPLIPYSTAGHVYHYDILLFNREIQL